jgi:hypothetical protein
VVEQKQVEKLNKHERLLQQYNYAKGLDAVLDPTKPVS